ncbi:hypothetical protein H6G33_36440 [Calothrix sp. FACHB-1219]|uniref:hypothetical protein n=1 Tax=unclassified Calothrix TaxID=2619626 RepID=UPI0016886FA1|nr:MULTISPECIES: hypothetical protein [unclassified Calothrix]MBD2207843.1 hypothetical protein [Calothrix sp. FACHB-168]MBD2222422.1 hypothetical protein [Calothrix sp. FACHB-1219]
MTITPHSNNKSSIETSRELEQKGTKEHSFDDSEIPESVASRNHVASVPMRNKDEEDLAIALAEKYPLLWEKEHKTLFDQVTKLTEAVTKLTDKVKKIETNEQIDNQTRSGLVNKLTDIFMMIIVASILLIIIGSLGGGYVNKEMIQQFVPLLVNVASGLIGVVIGYYFTGNNNKKR